MPKRDPGKPTDPLSEREAAFVREYLVDGNGSAAAIRAGYAKSGAKVTASRLITRTNVRVAIEKAQQRKAVRLQEKVDVSLENVVAELAKIAFANHADYVKISADGEPYIDLSGLTREQAAAISETYVEDVIEGRGPNKRTIRKVRLKFHDKRSALVDLGKHLGGFRTNVDLGTQKGDPIRALMEAVLANRSALPIRPSTQEDPT